MPLTRAQGHRKQGFDTRPARLARLYARARRRVGGGDKDADVPSARGNHPMIIEHPATPQWPMAHKHRRSPRRLSPMVHDRRRAWRVAEPALQHHRGTKAPNLCSAVRSEFTGHGLTGDVTNSHIPPRVWRQKGPHPSPTPPLPPSRCQVQHLRPPSTLPPAIPHSSASALALPRPSPTFQRSPERHGIQPTPRGPRGPCSSTQRRRVAGEPSVPAALKGQPIACPKGCSP